MCGVFGVIRRDQNVEQERFLMALRSQEHRGPDAESFAEIEPSIWFGHNRLKILDLSDRANQPMATRDKRYWLTYNGEIYNYSQIDIDHTPQTSSDSEVLLYGLAEYGVSNFLKKTRGMFAFGFFDTSEKTLYLARDRFGEKPLYYYLDSSIFVFSSEIKAILSYLERNMEICPHGLGQYFKLGYIPAPSSIFKRLHKVSPASIIRFDVAAWSLGESESYWELEPKRSSFDDYEQALEAVEERIQDAIRLQLVSDVPVGTFLSGGVDSTCVSAFVREQRDVKSFTIGFQESEFDESQTASETAKQLGIENRQKVLDPHHMMERIRDFCHIYDEPFADHSGVPTLMVAELARENVTVALSGDGADELFGGYNRYRFLRDFHGKKNSGWLRNLGYFILRNMSAGAINTSYSMFRPMLPAKYRANDFSSKLVKLSRALGAHDDIAIYDSIVSLFRNGESGINCPIPGDEIFRGHQILSKVPHGSEKMMVLDSLYYLPGDILTKVDRATMRVSLESRSPFLDHKLWEFVWTLPLEFKMGHQKNKRILRDLVERRVTLPHGPKQGFTIPLREWLVGPLQEWATDVMEIEVPFLDHAEVRVMWECFCKGELKHQEPIWSVLVYKSWYQTYFGA